MAYIPNPYELSQPTTDKYVETAAAELRGLKLAISLLRSQLNYLGDWSALTGPATVGSSVTHTGIIYLLTADLADITTAEPGVDPIWYGDSYVKRTGDTLLGHLSGIAGATGAQVPQAQETAMLATTQLAGNRNKIINGNFAINQRGYVSGTATTGANQYTLDRWRVVVSGQSVTFAASGIGNEVTAPAGGVEQVIEGLFIEGGTFVLNWAGTATAEVNGTAILKGGTFTLTANTNATVRFSSGTVSNVQIEAGIKPTPFECRMNELELCHRYLPSFGTGYVGDQIGMASGLDVSNARISVMFPVRSRVPPTGVFLSGASHTSCLTGNAVTLVVSSVTFQAAGTSGAHLTCSHTAAGTANLSYLFQTADVSAKLYFTGCEL